eukprot:sb/3476858/
MGIISHHMIGCPMSLSPISLRRGHTHRTSSLSLSLTSWPAHAGVSVSLSLQVRHQLVSVFLSPSLTHSGGRHTEVGRARSHLNLARHTEVRSSKFRGKVRSFAKTHFRLRNHL